MLMPKKRLISGMLNCYLSQHWEEIFGFLTGNPQIDCIGADINLFIPRNFTAWADMYFLEFPVIVPKSKNTFPSQIGKIYDTLNTV